MSTITDVSNVLGEYMLKGWILTDESCPNQNCNVPLMRSPDRQLCFCANCDGGPSSQRSSDSSTPSTSHTHSISRSSTPATEMSSLDSFQLPPETPESRRRREQSDQASTEIGKRLLKGWALLGDECWNESCFAVPLVRAPKTAGSKDPRKECVACGRIYVNEGDLVEGNSTLPIIKPSQPSKDLQTMDVLSTSAQNLNQALPLAQTMTLPAALSIASTNGSSSAALITTVCALEQTLLSLSGRLTGSTGLNDTQTIVDTISKTTLALSEVKKLQWKEMHSSYQ